MNDFKYWEECVCHLCLSFRQLWSWDMELRQLNTWTGDSSDIVVTGQRSVHCKKKYKLKESGGKKTTLAAAIKTQHNHEHFYE